MRTRLLVVCLCLLPGTARADQWVDLIASAKPDSALAGQWRKSNGELTTTAATSSRIAFPHRPGAEYEIEASFTRRSGVHSIALIFPVGDGQATFEVDAWGRNLAGLQMIDGQRMTDHQIRSENIRLQNGRLYTMKVQVRRGVVTGSLDGKVLFTYRGDGSNLSVFPAWRLPNKQAIGVGAYQAEAVFHRLRVRNLSPASSSVASARPMTTRPMTTRPMTPRPARPMAPAPTPSAGDAKAGKRVLMVIANRDFYYREYSEPRQELERAGFQVDVAAARRGECRPHVNSGQSGDGGVVQADLALADADSARYAAIVFVGGHGSSMYQYAFPGNYRNSTYNGPASVKAAANRLINEFARDDKHIAAICHGVSVLAWSRVNNRSLLNGRRVAAPSLPSPPALINGRAVRNPSRWESQTNGARVAPSRALGDPNTVDDNVMVDRKIVTAEDDKASRAFGSTLAKLLKE